MEDAYVWPYLCNVKNKAMAVKETIAIVGIDNKVCADLIKKLAQHYRLLLVSTEGNNSSALSKQIVDPIPDAAIEIIECAKDGCWEADIILLIGTTNLEKGLINRIKEVATQKIVVGISVGRHQSSPPVSEVNTLQLLLPYSKVVQMLYEFGSTATFIASDDEEALQTISDLIKMVGYQPIIVERFV